MRLNFHYIKNNDYPKDNFEKLLVVKDNTSDEPPLIGYSYKIGFWRKEINSWDSFSEGFIDDVVAWSELPTNKYLNL